MDAKERRKHEQRLEDFLSINLDLIEPRLNLIKRQKILNDTRKRRIGVLDIFADSDRKRIIGVELKVTKLSSRDLGQAIGYYSYFKQRSDRLDLPLPKIVVVGPKMDPIYEYGLMALKEGVQISTFIYTFPLGHGVNDDEWVVDLKEYDPENQQLRIPR